MEKITAPPLDAEKCASGQLVDNYRLPPDLERQLSRSTLLVGSRGSGKTMYLRRSRHTCPGLGIYGDLRKILQPLSSDTGAGGRTFREIRAADEPPIRRKACALLSHWLYGTAVREDASLPSVDVHHVMPRAIREKFDPTTPTFWTDLREELDKAPLSVFREGSNRAAFEDFLDALGSAVQRSHGAFSIFLDRAEEIPYPALTPVMNLLDQRHQFMSVVATRPGLLGPEHQLSGEVPSPGDHYNVRHLGLAPYSMQWRNFVMSTLSAWMPVDLLSMPESELEWICAIARDSVRTALEILYNAVDDTGCYQPARAQHQLRLIRSTQIKACQGELRSIGTDVPALLKRIRAQMPLNRLPVKLEVEGARQQDLLRTAKHVRDFTNAEQALYVGLRTGLFRTLHAMAWHPAAQVYEVEVPPLFLWEEGDQWSSI